MVETIKLGHVLRNANKMVGILINLTATLALKVEENMNVPMFDRWIVPPLHEELNEGINEFSA